MNYDPQMLTFIIVIMEFSYDYAFMVVKKNLLIEQIAIRTCFWYKVDCRGRE